MLDGSQLFMAWDFLFYLKKSRRSKFLHNPLSIWQISCLSNFFIFLFFYFQSYFIFLSGQFLLCILKLKDKIFSLRFYLNLKAHPLLQAWQFQTSIPGPLLEPEGSLAEASVFVWCAICIFGDLEWKHKKYHEKEIWVLTNKDTKKDGCLGLLVWFVFYDVPLRIGWEV